MQDEKVRFPASWSGWSCPSTDYHRQALSDLAPPLTSNPHLSSGSFSTNQLNSSIKQYFKDSSSKLDPIHYLQLLLEQIHLQRSTSQITTGNVMVTVTNSYVALSSEFTGGVKPADDMLEDEMMFVYRIRIENTPENNNTVQVKSRHWLIKDEPSGRVMVEVKKGSPGIVGQTPILKPGSVFQYQSRCDIPVFKHNISTPFESSDADDSDDNNTRSNNGQEVVGSMEGSFEMAVLGPDKKTIVSSFDAQVANFKFILPYNGK
jgi:uncharacterized protein affecting Mg2+/Co2+ transport